MSDFVPGDIIVCGEGVHIVLSITKEGIFTPDGFLVIESGSRLNPKFCRKYTGAISAIEHLLPEDYEELIVRARMQP